MSLKQIFTSTYMSQPIGTKGFWFLAICQGNTFSRCQMTLRRLIYRDAQEISQGRSAFYFIFWAPYRKRKPRVCVRREDCKCRFREPNLKRHKKQLCHYKPVKIVSGKSGLQFLEYNVGTLDYSTYLHPRQGKARICLQTLVWTLPM